ncbi:zinc ABC transporter ATP-binding protein ZnuC [Arenibaculum pallidiluteum]|uniref:zinc ABC transporter ATP-binding protein ZnuC n=1 Tax=Arenibaculum pallidiluteum TaxID=2812559 RepID=UPI001A96304E|nr:zinc ABC transporter ATP-binding protein ZnuC [Arenibaculum pallidiluteum]
MPEGAARRGELVRLDGVTVRFGGRPALSAINLDLHAAEVVTVIGPNGAGKSTLARVVLGLEAPEAGRVWRRPGLRIGYMPQRLVVDPVLPLPVGRLLTLTRRASAREVASVLDEVGAGHLVGRAVQTLSGGEMQRVMLARALVGGPDLLVLDEPAQNVDVVGQAELYDLVARFRRERGCGVLMISHDLHVVMAATDRVVCLHGHVCCSGAPEDVGRHPEYLALFGPAAASSLAVYAHAHGHRHTADGRVEPLDACGHDHSHDHSHAHEHPHDHSRAAPGTVQP